uniref:DRBM domain-containing protein n=1 Tax=Timema bartmani TaxID=61472 RepID=A0A7R9F6Z1_9NEOP|nr:unnamed protein product [Timema bartmani]
MRLKRVNKIEANKNKNIVEHISLVKRTISHSVQQLQKICLNYQWVEARYHEQKIKTSGHKMVCHLNGITTEGWSLTKRSAKQIAAENMLARIEDWSDRDECKYGYMSLEQGSEDTAPVKIRSRTLKKIKENKEMSITEHIRKLADMHPVPQLQHLCQVYVWVRPQYQSSYENFKKDVYVITCTVNGFKTIGWGKKKRVAKFWAAGKMLVHLEENQDCEQFSYGYQVPLKIALEQTNVSTRELEEISNVPKNVSCHSLQSLTTEEEVFENHSKDSLIPESNGETNVIVKNDVDASSTPECKKDHSIFSESKEDLKIMKSYYEDASKISESKEDAKIMKNYYEYASKISEFKEDVKFMKNYYEDASKISESKEDAKIMKNYYAYASKISESKEDAKIMINYYEGASKISESKEDAKIMQEYDEDASIFVEGNVSLYPIWFEISPRSPGHGVEERTLHKKIENTQHLTSLGQNNSRVLNEIEQLVGKKPPNYILDLASLPPSSAAARKQSLQVSHQVQVYLSTYNDPQEFLNTVIDYFCKTPLAVL